MQIKIRFITSHKFMMSGLPREIAVTQSQTAAPPLPPMQCVVTPIFGS